VGHQSIIAVTHRLTRPVNYNQDNAAKKPEYMNLLDLDFKTANWVVLAISVAIGLGYVAVMPPARGHAAVRRRRARHPVLPDDGGIAIGRQYYFMWLFFPMTVLMHRAAYDPRAAVQKGTWAVLAVAGALMCLSFPVFPNDLQAFGNNLAAAALIAGDWSGTSASARKVPSAPCLRRPASYNPTCRVAPVAKENRNVQHAAIATRPRPHRCRFR